MKNIFTEHPESVGETYLTHMIRALRYALTFLILFFIVLIHAVLPFFFMNTASNVVNELNRHMRGKKGDE